MQLATWPGCCGASILYSLYELRARELKGAAPRRGHGCFVITSAWQTAEVKVLKKAGARSLLSWRNAGSGNKLTLWTFLPSRKRKKAKPKKKASQRGGRKK